jgi:hypothetical protein
LVAEGQHSKQKGAVTPAEVSPPGPPRPPWVPGQPVPFRLEHLILIGATGTEPVPISAMTFGHDGIGVIRYSGELPRVLPWTSVTAHAVESWQGGAIPEWWVDPELNRDQTTDLPTDLVLDPGATSRPHLQSESGALIVIQTPTGIYRFIHPGGDARSLAARVTAFAVRYQGPGAVSTATRAVAWGHDVERRKTERLPEKPARWVRMRPYLAVLLVLFVATAIALILLQSAGVVHLPFLGGSSSTGSLPVRTR